MIIALSVIRFWHSRTSDYYLNNTKSQNSYKEYWDIYKLASVKAYFHSGLDNEIDYKVLFNRELPTHTYRGCVTVMSSDSEPIMIIMQCLNFIMQQMKFMQDNELEDFSLTDIKMLSQILKRKVAYLDKNVREKITTYYRGCQRVRFQ